MSTDRVKERPFICSGPEVISILEGRKTQARRLLKVNEHPAVLRWQVDSEYRAVAIAHSERAIDQYVTTFPHGRVPCRYGVPGDRLWVRETLGVTAQGNCEYMADRREINVATEPRALALCAQYGDSYHFSEVKKVPSIHMSRWASRITLQLTDVRVERLQDISEEDAKDEGVELHRPGARIGHPYRYSFAALWDSINLKIAPWSSSPWVWALTFRRIE